MLAFALSCAIVEAVMVVLFNVMVPVLPGVSKTTFGAVMLPFRINEPTIPSWKKFPAELEPVRVKVLPTFVTSTLPLPPVLTVMVPVVVGERGVVLTYISPLCDVRVMLLPDSVAVWKTFITLPLGKNACRLKLGMLAMFVGIVPTALPKPPVAEDTLPPIFVLVMNLNIGLPEIRPTVPCG